MLRLREADVMADTAGAACRRNTVNYNFPRSVLFIILQMYYAGLPFVLYVNTYLERKK